MKCPYGMQHWNHFFKATHFLSPDVGMEGSVKTLVALFFPRRKGH